MLIYKRLLQNSVIVLIASVVLKSVNIIAFILISRMYGPDPSGIFSLSTSYLALFSTLTSGFDELVTRQVSHNRQNASNYFKLFVWLRPLFSFGLYLILLVITIFVLDYPSHILFPILIMTTSFFFDGLAGTAQSILSAFESFGTFFISSLINAAIRIVTLIFLLFIPLNLNLVSWLWTGGSLISATILLIKVSRLLAKTPQDPSAKIGPTLAEEFRLIVSFLLIGFMSSIEYQIDVIILSAYHDQTIIGFYTAVTTILFSLFMLGQAYRMAVYPVMARYEINNPEKLGPLCADSYDLLWTLSLPMVIGIAILAPQIIPMIYGGSFQPAVLATRIIIWALIFLFISIPNSRLLLASGNQKRLLRLQLICTGINILVNLLLIPPYAAAGAAVSRVLSVVVYFFLSFAFIKQRYNLQLLPLAQKLVKSALAGLLMAFGVWLLREQSLLISIATGVFLYGGFLILLRRSDFLERRNFINIDNSRL